VRRKKEMKEKGAAEKGNQEGRHPSSKLLHPLTPLILMHA
jgi:hypothetical protein